MRRMIIICDNDPATRNQLLLSSTREGCVAIACYSLAEIQQMVDAMNPAARIMHCMPCHVGYEITRDAIDHPHSLIFGQAENRMHIQKAILLYLNEKL